MAEASIFPREFQGQWHGSGKYVCSVTTPESTCLGFKVSRSTGVTCGRYTEIMGTEFTIPVEGAAGSWTEIKSQDHTIAFRQREFAKPGDLGAFILDQLGNMMGLLVGGSSAFNTMNFTGR